MARYRTYTIEFKRRVVEEHLSGGTSLSELARRHDISRELLRIWVKKYEAGEFASDGPVGPDRRAYQAKIAGLERLSAALTSLRGIDAERHRWSASSPWSWTCSKRGSARHAKREARAPAS
jgi:transposase-like protein